MYILNMSNYYWIVGGSTTEVWSSDTMSYVPLSDATYAAWRAAGNQPTVIDTAANLLDVLAQQVFPRRLQSLTITSTATPALNGTYTIGDSAQQTIVALSTGIAAGKPVPGGDTTFNYANAAGEPHAFTAVNFLNFATAVENYIYNYTQGVATRLAGGTATIPSSAATIA